jgi:hypothetical protein
LAYLKDSATTACVWKQQHPCGEVMGASVVAVGWVVMTVPEQRAEEAGLSPCCKPRPASCLLLLLLIHPPPPHNAHPLMPLLLYRVPPPCFAALAALIFFDSTRTNAHALPYDSLTTPTHPSTYLHTPHRNQPATKKKTKLHKRHALIF